MAGPVSLNFASAPAVLPAYLKILFTRKPLLAAESVPRIEAILSSFRVDPQHLARYRAICGERESGRVPDGTNATESEDRHGALHCGADCD